jgi:CHAT domain-containing protein
MKLRSIVQSFAAVAACLAIQVQAANAPGALTASPPPGVQSLIEQVRAAAPNQDLLQKVKQIYGTEIPANASVSKRADMLKERSVAAEELGELHQKLADLKEVADIYRADGDARKLAAALIDWGIAEMVYGKVSSGEAACKEVLQITSRTNGLNGLELLALGSLTNLATEIGDLDEATKLAARGRALMESMKSRPGGYWAFIPQWEALVFNSEARLLIAKGQWDEGEAKLRLAVAKTEELAKNIEKLTALSNNITYQSNLLATRNVMVSYLAKHLMAQGKFDEAELTLRDILQVNLQKAGRMSIRTTAALNRLADLMGARGRVSDGLALLQEVEQINQALGIGPANYIGRAFHESRINLLVGQQNWPAVVRADEVFRTELKSLSQQRLAQTSPGLAIALLQTAQADEAYVRLKPVFDLHVSSMGEDHPQVAQERGILAMALMAQGKREEAMQLFAKAATVLLSPVSVESDGQDQSLRTLTRTLVLEAYLDALADQPNQPGAADTAFRIADALHLGKTQQALSQSAARAASQQADLAALIREDQDRKAEKLSLYGQLLRLSELPAEQRLPKVMDDMRARIAQIDKLRLEFNANLQKRFPAYANLIQPKAPSLEQTRAVLKDKEALINLFSTDRATYVWAVSRDAPTAFTRVAQSRQAVAQTVAKLRRALDPGEADLARGIPAFDLAAAHRLYLDLLAPVASAWKGTHSLLVVSNGALGQLPLGLLPTAPASLRTTTEPYAGYKEVPWLIKEVAITQLPSANALVTLRSLPAGNASRRAFIGFGDPDFSLKTAQVASASGLRRVTATRSSTQSWMPYSDLPPLPDTRDEILALAEVLKADTRRDVFLGRDASKANVLKTPLHQSRVVAFATHGLLPGEFPGVDQPSLALANPGQGQHGLLTLDDILSLKLDADWVVLSACNTAAGDGNGAEAVSGLGRGFFYAGTRALLATHWPVESVSARLLVTETFEQQAKHAGMGRAQALRASMLTLMGRQSSDGFSYAHPLFWAPYALFGDGGQ